jgi:PAS domain-containing protein
MMTDTNVVRRWTRIVGELRSRGVRVRRQDPAAVAPRDAVLEESLEACNGLLQDLAAAHLVCEQLRRELRAEALHRQYLMDRMPVGCLSTDEIGVIQNANQSAGELFNISAKHLRGRMLLHFAADRPAFARLLADLPGAGNQVEASLPVRPRERGPFKLNAVIVPESPSEPASWLWFLSPAPAARRDAPAQLNPSEYSEQEAG